MISPSFSLLCLHHSRPVIRNRAALSLLPKRSTSSKLARLVNAYTTDSPSTQLRTKDQEIETAFSDAVQKALATKQNTSQFQSETLSLLVKSMHLTRTNPKDPRRRAPRIPRPNSPNDDAALKKNSNDLPAISPVPKAPKRKLRKSVDQRTIHLETDPQALRETLRLAAKEALSPEWRYKSHKQEKSLVPLNGILDSLPPLTLPDQYQVVCTRSKEQVNATLAGMILEHDRFDAFGLDMEWKPTFVKGGKEEPVGLLQICSGNKVLLIQVSAMKGTLPTVLVDFLENKKLLKAGVGVCSDAAKLQREMGVAVNGLVDLGRLNDMVREQSFYVRRYTGHSLKTLTGIYMGAKMLKGKVRLSNWSASKLTQAQINYASKDVYASYAIYRRIQKSQLIKVSKMPIVHMPIVEPPPSSI